MLVTLEGSAARIVLNRPEKRNALSLELMDEVTAALRDVAARGDAGAIVIEGAGAAAGCQVGSVRPGGRGGRAHGRTHDSHRGVLVTGNAHGMTRG